MLKVFAHDPHAATELGAVLEAPGLYDEVLRYLTLRLDPKMLRHFEKNRDAATTVRGDAELPVGRDD